MPKERGSRHMSAHHSSILHSLPSFNKSDRLSVKVASLLNAARNTPEEDLEGYLGDRRRSNPHRRTLGGRGREWASESLKLLEALLELEDSKPVREPVNPLKFPDYYSQVENPLDLSKVMLKFHGGSYPSLIAFAADMRLMFNNYKLFFKHANSEIYTQVHRLSWWFEAEFTRISEKWGRKQNVLVSDLVKQSASTRSANRGVGSSSGARIGEDGVDSPGSHPHSPVDQPENSGSTREASRKRKRFMVSNEASLGKIQSVIEDESDLQLSDNNAASGRHDNLVSKVVPRKDHRHKTPILHHRSQSETFSPILSRLKPGTLAQLKGAQKSLNVTSSGSSNSSSNISSPLPDFSELRGKGNLADFRMEMDSLTVQINLSNIWLGTARIKPTKPALLCEASLQISINYGDKEIPFTIHAEEIVRCIAHFGRSSQKHTLFMFVLPSCSKRLEALNSKYSNCSMIVIFLNSVDYAQISTLVHIFWNIGRKSLFGPIFSEVDQQGALMLLGNIKPGIMSRVANKYKGVFPQIPGVQKPSKKSVQDEHNDGATGSSGHNSNRKRKPSLEIDTYAEGINVVGEENEPSPTISSPAANAPAGEEAVEPESSIMPDSSMSQEPEQGPSSVSNPPAQTFDKDFAERLGASLQQGFKEGFTEVLKNLADTLYGKNLPPGAKEDESPDTATPRTDQMDEDGSDIEIVIPTDSEDEGAHTPTYQADTCNVEEGDLAVTHEKLSIRCPITQQIMKHPLKNRHCNHCYDHQGVEELIRNRKEKARCPVAGCCNMIPLNVDDMRYEYELWKYIQDKVRPDPTDSSKTETAEEDTSS